MTERSRSRLPVVIVAAIAIPFTAMAYTASSYHALQFSTGSSRRTTVTGDWSPGNNKAECGPGETLTGVDQYYWDWLGNKCCFNHESVEALCRTDDTQTFPHTATNCRNVNFATADNRSGFTWDWDVGTTKGECAMDEYVAGISQTTEPTPYIPSQVESILCCMGNPGDIWPDHMPDSGCVPTTTRQEPTSSGDWDPIANLGTAQVECGDGYYMAGVSQTAGMAHALLCCPMPEKPEIDPCVKNPHLPQCRLEP